MNSTKAIISITVGTVAIILGLTVKHFYAAKGAYGATSGREIPRWQGRLLFVIIGAMFVLFGTSFFLFDQ